MGFVADDGDGAAAFVVLGGEQCGGLRDQVGFVEPGYAAERGDDPGVQAAGAGGGVGEVDDGVAGGVQIGDGGAHGDGFPGTDLTGDHAEVLLLDAPAQPGDGFGVAAVAVQHPGGEVLAERGINLINGAGCLGLMRAVSDAALRAGGTVTGVIPHFMVEQGWHHKGLTRLIETETMHERKQLMANMSDGIIALPGGCGTLEELLEIITWKQLGLYLKPIVILNINDFDRPLLEMLEQAIEQNFMRREHGAIWHVARTPEEAVNLLYDTPVWSKEIRKFAAI